MEGKKSMYGSETRKGDVMVLSKFEHVKITGISTVVPPKEINIYDEAQYYDNNIKKIDRMRKMVGFWKRRVVDEDVTASDLAIQAAERLIQQMDIDKNSIDALIFVVQRSDHSAPANSFYIHNKLGLPAKCIAFDIRQGCPGWIYGLWVSSALIESGSCKKVLLLAADTPSVGIDLGDRVSAPVFGDAGCATLIDYSDKIVNSYYNITVDSSGYEAIITPASGFRLPYKKQHANCKVDINKDLYTPIKTKSGRLTTLSSVFMDGLAVFNFTINHVPKNINELFDNFKLKKEDITHFMCHQANKQIVQAVSNAIQFPLEKTPTHTFENYGNSSIVSIPVSINDNLKENIINGGDELCLCSGFGNGLACASAVLHLKDCYLSGVCDYKKPADHPTREEIIKYWKHKIAESE